jgi:hypothetical protein
MHELLLLLASRVEDAAVRPVPGAPPDAAGRVDAGPRADEAAVGYPAEQE